METEAAQQLAVEHPLVGLWEAGLPNGGEGLEEELLQGFPLLEPLLELRRLGPELLVGESLELGLDRRDVGRLLGEPLHAAALADAEDLLEGAELLGHGPT